MTVTETRLALPRLRVEPPALLHRADWPRFFLVLGVALFVGAVTVMKVRGLTPLLLPPDGAHYIADADSLFGGGARDLRHPPGFPVVVALVRPFSGEPASYLWSMAISLTLFVISLHVLLRRWLPFVPSLIGAVAGSFIPVVGELFGWGGGATLLGTVMLIFVLAAMEEWIRRGGKRGFLVGACIAATALTHPFPFAVAALSIAVRAAVLLVQRRKLGLGWDPLGVKGVASVAVVALPVVILTLPVYYGPSVSFGGFRPGLSWSLLTWALDDRFASWLLVIAAVVGIELSRHTGLITYALVLTTLVFVFPAVVEGHITYANRVEYLVPIVSALGIGSLATVVISRSSRVRWARLGAIATAVVLLGAMAFTAYLPKLQISVNHYNVWLRPGDLPVLNALQGGQGTVATSWRANDFSDGVLLAWFVEGLAKRSALGSSDAFLSNIPEQFQGGLDMQRLFAGPHGLDNGALQIAAGPLGATADLLVHVRSAGFNYPMLFVRSLASAYPVRPETMTSRIDDDTLIWTFRDADGRVVMERTASLDGETVSLQYVLGPDADPGVWAVELVPAPDIGIYASPLGGGVTELTRKGEGVEGVIDIRGDSLPFSLTAEDADVDLLVDGPNEVIVVDADRRSTLELEIRVDTSADPGTVTPFQQRQLLQQYDISDVIVYRDTGWMPRFELDRCYSRVDQSRRMVVYAVQAVICGGDAGL